MLNRPNSVLIGKDIGRTATLTGFPYSSSNNVAAGEVIVLDKNKVILAAGSTKADTDKIYIAQATSNTYEYTNPAGTVVTGVPELVYSDAIEAKNVKTYTGKSYTAKAEQTDSISLSGLTAVADVEYIVRIIYKDDYVNNHPGQFTQTYRVISADAVLDTLGAALAAKINAHAGRRVNATYTAGTDVLLLTARVITDCTSSLTDIDEFAMVQFDSTVNYIDSDDVTQSFGTTITQTAAIEGYGTWEKVRDAEKLSRGYVGVSNRTHFPVIAPDVQTVKNETYDEVLIESQVSYLSPDNAYTKEARIQTEIYLPENASQTANILGVLNPWMESAGLASVSV